MGNSIVGFLVLISILFSAYLGYSARQQYKGIDQPIYSFIRDHITIALDAKSAVGFTILALLAVGFFSVILIALQQAIPSTILSTAATFYLYRGLARRYDHLKKTIA